MVVVVVEVVLVVVLVVEVVVEVVTVEVVAVELVVALHGVQPSEWLHMGHIFISGIHQKVAGKLIFISMSLLFASIC